MELYLKNRTNLRVFNFRQLSDDRLKVLVERALDDCKKAETDAKRNLLLKY